MTAEPVNVFAGLWLGLLCLAGVHAVSISTCKSRNFEQSTQLDSEGKYIVCWNFNATHITFEVHVETAGYVGFGISPNGNMPHSDVVIGWVKDGRTYFSVSLIYMRPRHEKT